jgi:hypothetical protein
LMCWLFAHVMPLISRPINIFCMTIWLLHIDIIVLQEKMAYYEFEQSFII